MNTVEFKPNKSRYALIDRVLGRKTKSTDDLFDFCIMMFNSNKEKYQTLQDQKLINDDMIEMCEAAYSITSDNRRSVYILTFASVGQFILTLIVLGLITK